MQMQHENLNAFITEVTSSHLTLTIDRSEAVLSGYGRDWIKHLEAKPSAVVFPTSTQEVQLLVQAARRYGIALVPSGGRTGLSGGATAQNGEVVVNFERMNKILDWDETDQIVTCQAGVVTQDLQNWASDKGFYFPVDFAARGSSQIGGNIATNAGGIKVIRYGMMRDWVSGLQVVTARGEILDLNRGLIKNATGYDLRHLFIGSEGTLGFITEASIRLTAPPQNLSVLVLAVPQLEHVMPIYRTFRNRHKTQLTAFEFFSDLALDLVTQSTHLPRPFPTREAQYLLVESEQQSEEELLQTVEILVENAWISDAAMSQSETQAREFWRLREDISESTSSFMPYKNDISVRISKVPEFLQSVDHLLKQHYPHFKVVWFGHIGDGNMHINILKPDNMDKAEFKTKCENVNRMLFECIQKFGGSISAEHGVGLIKRDFLNYSRSIEEIQLMREIKQIFDPDQILNPGKVISLI